jgi:hypothetical protein
MDPYKNDINDFQQKHSIISMEGSKNCLKKKISCLLCQHSQIQADFGMLGMKEGSKHIQLHIKWPVWIHTRMIMMTFSKNIPSYPWKAPRIVEEENFILFVSSKTDPG